MTLEFDTIKKVIINISGCVYYKKNNTIWYGYPIFQENIEEFECDISHKLNDVAGYFLYLYYDKDQIILSTDITGGYRVYKYEDDDTLFITDDYKLILDLIKNIKKIEIDDQQLKFWKKHRYTFGDRTFIKQLNKIPPHTTLLITNKEIKATSYFNTNIKRNPNRKVHKECIKKNIINVFSNLKTKKQDIILLFSGGKDSVYLASILKELEINFTAVFFYGYPEYEVNFNDYIRAKNVAEQLNIPFFKIDINLDEEKALMPEIVDDLLFDRHFSLMHYGAFRKLKDKYAPNTIFINGQSSDSIFSFGPSEKTIGSFLKRILLYYPSRITFFAKFALECKNNIKLKFPKNKLERLRAFNDEKDYIFLINEYDPSYNEYIDTYNKQLTEADNSLLMNQMLIKINTFLQGSDNQVSIKAGRFWGFQHIILPFASPSNIYDTIQYKNNISEFFIPKYVINDKVEFPFNIKSKSCKDFKDLAELENDSANYFFNKIEEFI